LAKAWVRQAASRLVRNAATVPMPRSTQFPSSIPTEARYSSRIRIIFIFLIVYIFAQQKLHEQTKKDCKKKSVDYLEDAKLRVVKESTEEYDWILVDLFKGE